MMKNGKDKDLKKTHLETMFQIFKSSFWKLAPYQSSSAQHSITSISTLVCSRITVCKRCMMAVSWSEKKKNSELKVIFNGSEKFPGMWGGGVGGHVCWTSIPPKSRTSSIDLPLFYINIHTPNTTLHIFLVVIIRRICLTIKSIIKRRWFPQL